MMASLGYPHLTLLQLCCASDGTLKQLPFSLTHYKCDCIKLCFRLRGSLTQSVEYLPFKQRVARSSRARPTTIIRPHRLVRSRTPAFHAGNTGSNPVGDAK